MIKCCLRPSCCPAQTPRTSMAPAIKLFFCLYLAITLAAASSVADAARIAPDDLLPATSGVVLSGQSGSRSLLQNARASKVGNSIATAIKQATTPATLDAAVAADAAQLKLMKQGDKTAAKRATVRYYWQLACYHEGLSAAQEAAEQVAATRNTKQYVAAGVVDTRNKLLRASLALVEARPPTEAQCIKFHANEVSAGYQAAAVLGGEVGTDGFDSSRLWALVMEIMPDDLDKLMPVTANSKQAMRGM